MVYGNIMIMVYLGVGMKKGLVRRLFAGSMTLALCLIAGCRSDETPEYRTLPPVSDKIRGRAEALAQVWRADPVRSVLLNETDLASYRHCCPQLVERLRLLGVDHAGIAVESPDAFSGSRRKLLTGMIAALGEGGIRCDLVLAPHQFVEERPMPIFSRLSGGGDPFDDVLRDAVRLNRDLPEKHPLAGIAIRADVHRLTETNPHLPVGMLYRWRESDYGIGSDNDLMMKLFLQRCADWRKLAAGEGLKFHVAVPAFYHEKASAGQLSKGKVTDFLAVADTVTVIGYGTKPTEYLASLQHVLAAGGRDRRVRCGIALSGHVSDAGGAIRRRNWEDFLRILSAMHPVFAASPAYGGMVLAPWQSVELLQER